MKHDPRGSIWRRWDLHFHTPASYDYHNKSVDAQVLVDGLKAANVKVVAVTGHHVIDVPLIDEGEEYCQVYRSAPAWESRAECLQHDGKIYSVQEIYNGHRARYWPSPSNPTALSIPVGINCHHSIRLVRD